LLERMSDPQRDVLAPGRRDDLHANRQWLEWHRNRHHRQADERDRLGEMPRLARTGSSTPSSTKVRWPMAGAVQGVAGATTAST
jgi:hypothetical protein